MKSGDKDGDPIAAELYMIARHGWSRVGECTRLMGHPLIAHTARNPDDEAERAKALKSSLKRAVKHLKKKEKDNPPLYGRSVASASYTLLRLGKSGETKSLTKLREEVGEEWKSRKESGVSESTFRLHFEEGHVHKPFAIEFLAFAHQELAAQGIELAEDSVYLEPARTMAERMTRCLERLEEKWHDERIEALGGGSFRIKDEDEMLDVLLALTGLAEKGFIAVDHTPISKWSSSRQLKKYLRVQLKRVRESGGGITLERIRLVASSELTKEKERRHLVKFVKAHEDATASLLLMPIDALEDLEVTFRPHNGLLLADARAEPIAVTGRLGEGSVGRALVYTRTGNEIHTLLNEYESLKDAVEENDYDTKLREQLAG